MISAEHINNRESEMSSRYSQAVLNVSVSLSAEHITKRESEMSSRYSYAVHQQPTDMLDSSTEGSSIKKRGVFHTKKKEKVFLDPQQRIHQGEKNCSAKAR